MELVPSLQEIFGHGPPDCPSWEEKGDFKQSLNDSDAMKYAHWLKTALDAKNADLAQNLCFLDLTVASAKLSDFRGVLITPTREEQELYRLTVARLNGYNPQTGGYPLESRSVGSHAVFQAGLPVFKADGVWLYPEIRVPQESENYPGSLEDCEIKDLPVVDDRYLLWTDPEEYNASDIESCGGEGQWYATWAGKDAFGHPREQREYRRRVEQASAHPVSENWRVWMEYLTERRPDLRSLSGEPLRTVLGVPLCVWTASRPQYAPVAQIFIGTSGQNAVENAHRILRVIALQTLRSTAAGRAEYLGGVRSRYAAAHRLPGTLNAIMAVVQSELKRLPPICYELKAITTLQKNQLPRWEIYEDMCRDRGWKLSRDVIENIWEQIAVPLGQYRVQTDGEHAEYRQYWDDVPSPRIQVTGLLDFPEKELECSALISLCVPLLAEAYQHALIWAIKNRETNRDSPVVEIQISQDELSIDNVSATSARLPGFGREFTNQTDEIELIQRRAGYWEVIFPDAADIEANNNHWVVRSRRHEARPIESLSAREGS